MPGASYLFHPNHKFYESGFTNKNESIHDFFINGHSSTSISSALGLLTARELNGNKGKVIAVIGDGALTGGMAFEGLSHAGQRNATFST